ncbi:MAG: peptide chain release factor N(5)-glutamine methyltransferase [Xanthobacteraceae bacterium]|nr:peptide chain release factor N(5)-glutamine methyltransferase [Xanthobacteraceae bacterium]
MTRPSADNAVLARDSGASLTIAGARRAWAEKFRAAGIESAELDARILVGHALAFDHAALAAAGARILGVEENDSIAALAQRRLAREPVARIVGCKEFWSLRLAVDAATLVPRPETETVVEAALAAIDAGGARSRKLRIADLGTGSGALLLALLAELPTAFGIGTDISRGALRVAWANAQGLGLPRANFIACDLTAALGGAFDLIVSNPPYVASGDIAALAPEVRDFDPRNALDGGPDGLDCYRAIAATVAALLAPGGALVVELGSGQAQAVAALFAAAGLAPSAPRPDLGGVPRALIATTARMGRYKGA